MLTGLGIATALAAGGTLSAGLMADGFGALAGKNKEDPLKATKGAMKGMAGAAGINAGIAGAAGLAEAAPAVAGAAMQHPDKLAAGAKAVGDFASGAFDQGPPPPSKAGALGVAASKSYDWFKKRR